MLFPTLPAELSREIGERGSNGEKEMLRHFLGTGFKWRKGDVAAFSGEWGSQWRSRVIVRRLGFKLENGVHYFGKTRCWGSTAAIGDHLRKRKISGFKKSMKRRDNNPQRTCGVQAMVIPALPFILVSRSTLLFR